VPKPHVIVTTHTTRHLRRSLLGVSSMDPPPASITVSCDVDSQEIADLVADCSRECSTRLMIVRRTHMNACRLSQVRNNGVRALSAMGMIDLGEDGGAGASSRGTGVASRARVLYFDGDCIPAKNVAAMHARAGEHADLVIGFRVELTPEQTEAIDDESIRAWTLTERLTPAQRRELADRQSRYRRQLFFKRFGLTKSHKPKILGAHFSVSIDALIRVNGFDEEFIGWGQEDDDFSRRMHASGARSAVVVRGAIVLHQWHPTRAPGAWEESNGVERFRRAGPTRCRRGIADPVEQPALIVETFEGGRVLDRREVGDRPERPAVPRIAHDGNGVANGGDIDACRDRTIRAGASE
jgi:N-terminal domain of galactosyltransferase